MSSFDKISIVILVLIYSCLREGKDRSLTLFKTGLALPILTTLYSILNPNYGHARLGRSDATGTSLFLTLVQIAVPVLATWILYFHPITDPGSHGLMSFSNFSGKSTHQGDNAKPNARRLIVLGLSLSGILVIAAWAKRSSMSMGFPEYPEGQGQLRRMNGEYHEIANLILPASRFTFIDLASRAKQLTRKQLFSSSRFSFASS